MATLEQLGLALQNADAAGDVEAARHLAFEIQRQRSTMPAVPSAPSNGADTLAEYQRYVKAEDFTNDPLNQRIAGPTTFIAKQDASWPLPPPEIQQTLPQIAISPADVLGAQLGQYSQPVPGVAEAERRDVQKMLMQQRMSALDTAASQSIASGMANIGKAGWYVPNLLPEGVQKAVFPRDLTPSDIMRQAALTEEQTGQRAAEAQAQLPYGAEFATKALGAGTSLIPTMAVGPLGPYATALAGALQQGGSTGAEAQMAYEDKGLADAKMKSVLPALLDAAQTFALTKASGKLFGEGAEAMTMGQHEPLTLAKLAKGTLGEVAEEVPNQLISDTIAKASYNPEQQFSNPLEVAGIAALLGGAGEVVSHAGVKAPEQVNPIVDLLARREMSPWNGRPSTSFQLGPVTTGPIERALPMTQGNVKPKVAEDVVVPETQAEAGKDVNVLEEIRRANARTKQQIIDLFPEAGLSRQRAAELRDLAWATQEKGGGEGEEVQRKEEGVSVLEKSTGVGQPAPVVAFPGYEQWKLTREAAGMKDVSELLWKSQQQDWAQKNAPVVNSGEQVTGEAAQPKSLLDDLKQRLASRVGFQQTEPQNKTYSPGEKGTYIKFQHSGKEVIRADRGDTETALHENVHSFTHNNKATIVEAAEKNLTLQDKADLVSVMKLLGSSYRIHADALAKAVQTGRPTAGLWRSIDELTAQASTRRFWSFGPGTTEKARRILTKVYGPEFTSFMESGEITKPQYYPRWNGKRFEMPAKQALVDDADQSKLISSATKPQPVKAGAETVSSVLQQLAEDKNSRHAGIAQALLQTGDEKGLAAEVVTEDKPLVGNENQLLAGQYDSATDKVYLSDKTPSGPYTKIHEIVHALSVRKLFNELSIAAQEQWFTQKGKLEEYAKNGKHEGVRELAQLFLDTKKELGEKNKTYGLSDIYEFMAEAFSNSKFQETLRGIKDSRGKSFWSRLLQGVRRLLGGLPDVDNTRLAAVIKAGEKVISMKRQTDGYWDESAPKTATPLEDVYKWKSIVSKVKEVLVRQPFTLTGSDKLISRLEAMKVKMSSGQLHAFGILPALWNAGIELAIKGVKAGKNVGQVMNEVVDYFKKNNKGKFDEDEVRKGLAKVMGIEPPKTTVPKAGSPQREKVEKSILKRLLEKHFETTVAPEVMASKKPAKVETLNKFAKAIVEAKPLREETEELRAKERAKRGEEVGAKRGQGSLSERTGEFKKSLKGELPRKDMEPLTKALSQAEVQELTDHLDEHALLVGEDYRAANLLIALQDLVENGRLPQPNQVEWFEKVFGEPVAKALVEKFKKRTMLSKVAELGNIARTSITGYDLSATLKQGFTLAVTHPKVAASAFKAQIRAFANEAYAKQTNRNLRGGERGRIRQEAGLDMPTFDTYASTVDTKGREEQFSSHFVQRLAHTNAKTKLAKVLFGPVKLWAKGLAASERSYVTYMNWLRATVFDGIDQDLQKRYEGHDLATQRHALAKLLNAATGRGNIRSTDLMNAAFFAPRYKASRFEYPVRAAYYAATKGGPVGSEARKQAFGQAGAWFALALLLKGAAEAFDWDVEFDMDPKSTTFLRATIGKKSGKPTSIDVSGGYGNAARYMTQFATSERKEPRGKLAKVDQTYLAGQLLRSSLSPLGGTGFDAAKGENMGNRESTVGQLLGQNLTPITAQQIPDFVREHDEKGLLLLLPELLGMSVTVPNPPKERGH